MKSKEPRERGAGNVIAAAQKPQRGWPTTGITPAISVPTLVAKKASLFQGKVAAKTETDRNEQKNDSTDPRHLARRW